MSDTAKTERRAAMMGPRPQAAEHGTRAVEAGTAAGRRITIPTGRPIEGGGPKRLACG